MYNVFYSVLPIFLIALLGSVIRRKWLSSDEFWRGLEKLLFYVLFPAVLFEYSSKADLGSSEFLRLTIALMISTLVIAVIIVIYQEKEPYDKAQFTSVFQGSTRYNNYIFFALGAALFGDEGLKVIATISPYLLILTNITAIIAFTHYVPKGSGALTKRKSFMLMVKSIIGNPFVFASIAGVVFNYMDLTLNIAIEKTIQSLADSALAIGILIVGAGIQFRLKQEYLHQVMFTSAIKLALMPVVTFVVLWIMGITGVAKSVGILFSCLPCSSSSYILSRQLGGDPETMSSIITFTTIFSILSLSLLVYILV
ncbi:AEC family transporter [Rickettsiaceae bacterium]|nr:AEC family transporter [Rickettsiaceae bacterium]